MKTLEEAILDLENWVSGIYREPFPNSNLRQDPEEHIEFIKFNLETLQKAKKTEVKNQAFESIIKDVLDNHAISSGREEKDYFDYARKHSYLEKGGNEYYINKCIDDCNIIISRLAENEQEEDGGFSIEELNKKYHHTILYFNGDENGSQYVYVEDIHRGKDDDIEVDGVLIDFDFQEHTINVNSVEDFKFSRFYYFGPEDDEEFTSTKELDEALQSTPCDTELPSHVISPMQAVKDILEIFRWYFIEDYETRCPELGKIFTEILDKLA